MKTIADRFELGEPLGPGLYAPRRAVDLETGDGCVVRELTLGRLSDWKELELFERETSALRQLEHPGIPRFLASFKSEEGEDPRYFLVQSYVEGTPLTERAGRLMPDEAREYLKSLLEILAYLQSFSPPVLHRDITPDKVVLRDDGSVALVDFGSVQVELKGTTGGSTMVGTSGYMAPEQLMGRAVPASDVFAVGTTFAHVLTGIEPNDLPTTRMKLQWRDRASGFPDRLLDIVDRMLEPDPDRRFADAREVLRALGGGGTALSVSQPGAMIRATRPAETDIELKRSGRRLEVKGATTKVKWKPYVIAAIVLGGVCGFAVYLSTFHVILTLIATLSGGLILVAPWIRSRRSERGLLRIDIDRGYRVRAPAHRSELAAGPFRDIIGPDRGHGSLSGTLYLATEDEILPFATGCTPQEQDWLIDEIADFIREQR